MDLGTSTSSDLPRGIAARHRRSSTLRGFPSSGLRHGDFCATGVISKPPPATNFLTYMYFLAEHKHEIPVLSSVREFVDRGEKIGQGATFSVCKGSWKDGQAAFKFMKDSVLPTTTRQDGNPLDANHMDMVRRNREYLNAMRSLMFEIKIMAKKPLSQHKNIVRLLAISWDEDDIIESSTLEDVIRPVLVVELAWEEHPDLASFMKFCSQSPGSAVVEDVLSLVSDVADGLAALHSFGVVHGDLKPQNILLFLDPDKAVAGPERKHKFPALVAKIGDFGFSGTISTEEDVHGGTQFWNAPECLPSCPDAEMRSYATKQTRDIYSYALILVHLVTNGGSPFEGFATDLNAIDAAKLEGRVADHCCDLIRRARSFDLSDKLIDTIVDFLAGALLHNPCDRLCNIGGVRELLTGIPLPNSTTQAFTKATFFSIHIQGVPDTMEYGHTDLSTFWRGASTQIPESRKALLRRGVDFKYISTLTKEERHSIFYAGHAFINAENASKGLPLICPATVMDPDLLQTYTNEQAQQLVKEFTELGNDMERSIMADTGTEEMEQTLRGLAYFYEKREFPSPIVSLRNCIEMNQASLANFLIRHGKVSADEHIGSNFTLLHLAAMRNRPSFVPILVACGLDINQKGGNVGFTPLHEAIRAGSYEATIALLDAGADIEFCSDSFSNTPPFSPFELALQCPNRDSKMLSLLLDRGAKYGHTTQSLAVLESVCQYPDLLVTLLDHEPGLSLLETRKRTLLHAAVAANQPKSIKILLERGADVNARDVVGRTPLATLSSINQLGTYMSNGIFGISPPLQQIKYKMWNPQSFDEIQQLLIDYGGEEPDDYIYTLEERNMMVAVARYMYWIENFITSMSAKFSMSTLVRSLMAGKGVLNESTSIEIMADALKDQREVVKSMLQCMHFLAKSTAQLPLESEVFGLKFTVNFKKYLAGWLKPVNWDEMMDFILAVARYSQDPCEPQTSLPEGIDDATLERILQEMDQAIQNGGIMSLKTPDSRLVMSWVLNTPVPDDIDAAIDCLTSPYVPELPRGASLSEPARRCFEQLAALQSSIKPGEWSKLGDIALSLNNLLESTGQPSIKSPPKHLLLFDTKRNLISSTTYQPSFLSDFSPYSPIWVCLPTESLLSRKLRIFIPVALIGLTYFALLWRVMGWVRWLTFGRIVSIVLLHGIRNVLVTYPRLLEGFTFFAPIIAICGWLAQGSVWRMLLECNLTYGLLTYILSEDSDDSVLKQVRFRMRYGFPEVEPLIMSHKAGEEWKYNFLDLFESMWGNYSLSNIGLRNWIHRPDAVAAILDQWAIEEVQGLESSRKNWDRGWWYYIESENIEDEEAETKSHPPRSGYWKKFNFLAEDTLPDRDKTMRAFTKIEKILHTKCRPELYQTFREMFPHVTTREKYLELENMFKDYPDVLHIMQGIWVD